MLLTYAGSCQNINMCLKIFSGHRTSKIRYKNCSIDRKADDLGSQSVSVVLRYFLIKLLRSSSYITSDVLALFRLNTFARPILKLSFRYNCSKIDMHRSFITESEEIANKYKREGCPAVRYCKKGTSV